MGMCVPLMGRMRCPIVQLSPMGAPSILYSRQLRMGDLQRGACATMSSHFVISLDFEQAWGMEAKKAYGPELPAALDQRHGREEANETRVAGDENLHVPPPQSSAGR